MRGVLVVALVAIVLAAACDPEDRPGLTAGAGGAGGTCGAVDAGANPQCSFAPSSCEPGTTCWLDDKTGNKYTCLPSVSGARGGTPCESVIGTAHCDDGFFCFTRTALDPGVCTAFCDACGHPCDTGTVCTPIQLVGGATIIHACLASDGG